MQEFPPADEPPHGSDSAPPPSDNAAFMRLYLQHESTLRAILRTMLGSWHEVDDVVQETCLVAMRKFDTFQPGSNFVAWIAAIGRFETRRYLRNRATRRWQFAEEVLELIEADASQMQPLAERGDALEQCLQRLPEKSRQLLRDLYIHETPVQTIAQRLNRSIEALYKQSQRLRRDLLDCIERTLHMESAG
ncbi:Hypothetical protein PBC10988_30600 [Planctomycetales bacterium 10988]|nr:Hypothetical protein PBC10988_30600 [Planctomycetales bacterium 10988]